MRITAFRSWVNRTMQTGWGATRRAGLAISRRIREATGKVDAGVGVGDDESSFGGGRGSRAWFEILEEAVRRIRELFEKSKFERRYVKVENFLRKLLGLPPREKIAPSLPPPPKKRALPKAPPPMTREQQAKLRQQLQIGRIQANTTARAGLRDLRGGDRARPTAEAIEVRPRRKKNEDGEE